MLRKRKREKNPEKVLSFQREFVKLYQKFVESVEALCKRYGVEVNCWYSPSMIPQPKFIIDGVVLDADDIYNEKDVREKLEYIFLSRA